MIVLMLKLKIKMLSVIPNKFQLLFVYHLVILDYEEITFCNFEWINLSLETN